MAGLVLRCEDLSGRIVAFDGAGGTLAVYMLTCEQSRLQPISLAMKLIETAIDLGSDVVDKHNR
jgi:hypothetical protein